VSNVIALVAKVLADTSDYQKNMQGAMGPANDLEKSLSTAGTRLTAGLTVPLIGAGFAAVTMASDVNESIAKVGELFGPASEAVVAWSTTTAEAMGISQASSLAMVGELGNILIAQGLSEEAAARMAMEYVTLSGDMASFNNASPEETFRAITAGAIGSSEPLRKYGVVLTEDSVKQKALEMTGKATTKELTAQDLTVARLTLTTEQTTAAHGDFTRTSDGLANQTRITTAQFKDQTAEIGTKLLPIALKLMGEVSKLIGWYDGLSVTQQDNILKIAGLVAAIGPLLLVLAKMISAVSTLWPILVTLVSTGILPVIAAVGLMITAWNGIIDSIGRAWDIISGRKSLLEEMRSDFDRISSAVSTFVGWIQTAISWLGKIKIPSAIKRSSPSPLEQSIMGVSQALDKLSMKQIGILGSGASAAPITYQLNYVGVSSTEMSVTQRLDQLRLLRS
jgi:hypothetical protein